MTIWAVIPVKPIAEGKSRLARALSPPARERLNAILFRQTLDAVSAVIPARNIMVISRDGALLEQAASRGMRAIAEQGNALNDALNQAARLAPDQALLAISTDLPGITAQDVSAMLADLSYPAVAIAPDRAKRGTNALFMAQSGCIPFRFGEDSFTAHVEESRRQGIEPKIIARPNLAFDLDLPEDLRLCPPDWFGFFGDHV